MRLQETLKRLAALALALLLGACAPDFDWREVRGPGWLALMPAKPISQERRVTLAGLRLDMTMQAAEVYQATYAVGYVNVPDASLAGPVLEAMKDALLANVNADFKTVKNSRAANGAQVINVEASGTPAEKGRGTPRAVFARFVAKDRLVVQAIVIGPQDHITQESIETFFTGFKVP